MPHLLLLVAGIVVFFFLPAWLQVRAVNLRAALLSHLT